MELYLNLTGEKAYCVTDENNTIYPVTKAKALFNAGKVSNYNLAFGRLISFDFDIEKVKAYYIEADKKHNERYI